MDGAGDGRCRSARGGRGGATGDGQGGAAGDGRGGALELQELVDGGEIGMDEAEQKHLFRQRRS
jgi:hypothetical protein